MNHPKILVLSHGAFRLWHEGLGYCRKLLNDGQLQADAVRTFRYAKKKSIAELTTCELGRGIAALWTIVDGGYTIHDYLQWNATREDELGNRENNRLRTALCRDPEIRQRLRERDKDRCRYCSEAVRWSDRRGPLGATYDHIIPRGPATMENLVIACRSCNSRKGARTPEQAGMVLRPVPDDLDPYLDSGDMNKEESLDLEKEETTESEIPIQPAQMRTRGEFDTAATPALADRARELVENYSDWFYRLRKGARYKPKPAIDYFRALDVVSVWPDDGRIKKLAEIVLVTDDEWIASTDRGFGVFCSKVSWADDRLRQWEITNGVGASN